MSARSVPIAHSLRKIAATFSGLRSLDRLGEVVRDAARELVGADGTSVLLADGRGWFHPRHSTLALLRAGEGCRLDASIGGQALRSRSPVIIADVASDPRARSLHGLAESVAAVPIHGPQPEAPLGAIESYWAAPRTASPEEISLLELIAELTALGLRALQTHSEVEAAVRARTANLEELSRRLLLDSAQRLRAEEDARRQAFTDEMTGLYNRRALLALGEPLLQEGRASGFRISVLYADVDGLKRVNDTLGHAAGDRLIVAAARALRSALRETDLVARVGGDEFCAILRGPQGDGSSLLARLAQLSTPPAHSGVPALSIGLSRDDGTAATTLPLLIQRADHFMYLLKRWRRERTVAADHQTVRLYGPKRSAA
jgi:diguanylate cyclase (GGDEF)-like protein